MNKVDIMKQGTSHSYAKSTMWTHSTVDGKFFVAREWTDAENWTLSQINPVTGNQVISDISLSSGGFAFVGNKLYFNTGVSRDFWTNRIESYGHLKVLNVGSQFSSSSASTLHSYSAVGDGTTKSAGKLYGCGDTLMSVSTEYVGDLKVIDIRKHDLVTGEITNLYEDLIVDGYSYGRYFAGTNTIYILIKEGNTVYVYSYPVSGQETFLFNVELLPGENGVYVSESNGKIAVAVEKDGKISTLFIYDIATKESYEVPIDPYSVDASFSGLRLGFPFVFTE